MASLRSACSSSSVQLCVAQLNHVNARFRSKISTKYFKRPWPRSFDRRLVHEVMKPILPRQIAPKRLSDACTLQADAAREQLPAAEIEIANAHALYARTILQDYRVLAVCQMLDVSKDFHQLQSRKMRPLGIDVKEFPNSVMQTALAGTRLAALNPLFAAGSSQMCLLLSATPRSVQHIHERCNALPYLHLLACVVDDRMYTAAETAALAECGDLELLPAQTCALIGGVPQQTSALLTQAVGGIAQSLSAREQQLTPDDTNQAEAAS